MESATGDCAGLGEAIVFLKYFEDNGYPLHARLAVG